MAGENSPGTTQSAEAAEATVRAVTKRYDALVAVRTKALKGKGAWYWANLEPLLVHGSDSGLPKAVKLRCSLCNAIFSASNPSRTASEHLKRGTCPNFSSAAAVASSSAPRPISSLPPYGKRTSPSSAPAKTSYLALVDPSTAEPAFSSSPTPPPPPPPPPALPAPHQRLLFSGGREDIDALAMLEDSVKRLKSPKASPRPALPKPLSDAALSLLTDWFLESAGAASPSSLSHPKLQSFLHQIGLPALSPRRITGPLLDSRFHEARADSDARARDAVFFQLESAGWNSDTEDTQSLISLAVNLPNGTTAAHRVMLISARAPSDYAEEVLLTAIASITDDDTSRRLIKDFARDLPLFRSIAANCSRLSAFFNTHSLARALLHKHQLQHLNHSHLLHSPPPSSNNIDSVFAMLEDVTNSSHSLQSAILENEFKLLCMDDPTAREFTEMIGNVRFWTELEAVRSLVNLVKTMSNEMEAERPAVGRCLPIWNELRAKVKDWRAKFNVEEDTVDHVVERRFKKNYHPAWSAAFILDPLYLTKDASGKYLPPFKYLTPEQEKDVDRLITRLVSREEAHIALMELMKWRTEGLDPLYAQAVQVKHLDPATGKMKVANPQSSRLVWETCLSEFRSLGKVAVRLIFLHCTAYRVRCSASLLRLGRRSPAAAERVEKMVFVAAHARFERRSFVSNEEKDPEIFGEEEDVSAEASSVFKDFHECDLVLIFLQRATRRCSLVYVNSQTRELNLLGGVRSPLQASHSPLSEPRHQPPIHRRLIPATGRRMTERLELVAFVAGFMLHARSCFGGIYVGCVLNNACCGNIWAYRDTAAHFNPLLLFFRQMKEKSSGTTICSGLYPFLGPSTGDWALFLCGCVPFLALFFGCWAYICYYSKKFYANFDILEDSFGSLLGGFYVGIGSVSFLTYRVMDVALHVLLGTDLEDWRFCSGYRIFGDTRSAARRSLTMRDLNEEACRRKKDGYLRRTKLPSSRREGGVTLDAREERREDV
ncbi:hypothetical protein M5K25_007400 [Dendrobium thyrsiflorum]|uniref:DUF7963 domain-containing protein n=1 Tax=Dendrobium thyrsiflorum TaxID=117978 RepID=A0ABD0VL56_DENTH